MNSGFVLNDRKCALVYENAMKFDDFTAIPNILELQWCTIFTNFTICSIKIYKIQMLKSSEILTTLNTRFLGAGTFLKMY